MAHENKVLQSINLTDTPVCVDIFRRPDGSFGYEEYRRDPEDRRGWFPTGFYSDKRFASQALALKAACGSVTWLAEALEQVPGA
jgi:hypothetical protein